MVIERGDGGERTAADLVQERKYSSRLERLAALNEVRLHESSARKSSMAAAVDPRESVDLFLSSFAQRREALEVGLALARAQQVQPSSMKSHLENLSLEATAMEKSTADAAYFLPASVVKASQNAVGKLRDELDAAHAELVPKKRFSFRNKVRSPPEVAISPSADRISSQRAQNSMEASSIAVATNRGQTTTSRSSERDSASEILGEIGNSAQRIDGRSDAVIVRSAEEVGGEVTLSYLANCRVYLRGRFTTLVLHSLKNCHIYAGPVAGSVFIEHVESSVLVLASHQIRIHSTSCTDFYLRVRSKPIVEYTSKNRFAPYAFFYEGIEEDLEAANLAEETGLWEKVDDFRWLRAVHSPNWSVLPVEERAPVEGGSSVVGTG